MKEGEILGQFRVTRVEASYDYKTGMEWTTTRFHCLSCGSDNVESNCECGACENWSGHAGNLEFRGPVRLKCANCGNTYRTLLPDSGD